MTTTVLLRSGMRLKSHVPFCRAVGGVTRLLTLIIADRIERVYQLFFKHHGKGAAILIMRIAAL